MIRIIFQYPDPDDLGAQQNYYAFDFCPVGPTYKKKKAKMFKKYCFRYVTFLKRSES
jgi:hypothetical protein